MPNTPRSYNDIKKLAGEVPSPVALESIYSVTSPISDSKRRDLEIQELRRSLNSALAARYRLEQQVLRLNWLVTGFTTACVVLSIAGLLAIASTH